MLAACAWCHEPGMIMQQGLSPVTGARPEAVQAAKQGQQAHRAEVREGPAEVHAAAAAKTGLCHNSGVG